MKNVMIAAVLAVGVVLGIQVTRGRRLRRSCRCRATTRPQGFRRRERAADPSIDYKVVFSVAAKVQDNEIHPTLKTIALYLNTLANEGVPANHRHIVAVFHQGGGDAVFLNDVYKSRHSGVDNPNIAILNELKQAGVELRVCGQGLMGKKVEPSQLLPGVQADLWAMTTMVNLQLKGYVRVGG